MFWIIRLYNRFFSKDKDLAEKVRQITGFTPVKLSVFRLAFAHKSTQNSNPGDKDYPSQNNERLEYLGDAVLGTIVAEYLFRKYPTGDEGFLTKMRSKIVKRKSLNRIGEKMGMDAMLNDFNKTRISKSMLGNAVEALVGAIYVEKGYVGTRQFVVKRILRRYIDIHNLETFDDNYKSQLLEWCQKNGQSVNYKLIQRYKQDKRDRFRVAVEINGKRIAVADDFNKKSAEQAASERAMQTMGIVLEKGGRDDD